MFKALLKKQLAEMTVGITVNRKTGKRRQGAGLIGFILMFVLLFFSLSTIIGWSYYGERCWGYLSNENKTVNLIFKIIFVLVCIVGATGSGTLMWDISDTLNGLMAIPNLISLLLLSGVVITTTKAYFSKNGR